MKTNKGMYACLCGLGSVLVFSALLVGCGRNATNEGTAQTKLYSGNQMKSLGGIGNSQAPSNLPQEGLDARMGRNANPNLVVGHQDMHSKSADVKNLQMMAESVPGVEHARITINGGTAYVTLDMIPNVTAGEARNIEQQVISVLYQKAPRYHYRMTSHDGYHR